MHDAEMPEVDLATAINLMKTLGKPPNWGAKVGIKLFSEDNLPKPEILHDQVKISIPEGFHF